MASEPRVLQSVDRAVRVLELLAGIPGGLPLGQMAERLGIKPQTLQGILRSLQAHHFVLQSERGGGYSLGPRIHELSRTWLAGCDRAELASDLVRELAARIGESAMLSELRGGRLWALVSAQADQPLSVAQHRLHEAPLHTMATGKLLLAHLPAPHREELARAQDFTPRAPRTIAGADALIADLARTVKRGFALCDQEASEGVAAVAVAVRGPSGEVEAALGAAMPATRYSVDYRETVLAALRETAGEIERRWGGAAPH